MSRKKMGLLVMAYGTPYQEEDIERYYTHIRHGRRPSEELIADLKGRYEAIGGLSPLAKITDAQAAALESKLNASQDQIEFKTYLGLKHIEPFIEDAVQQMKEDGIEEAVSIVLAPHFSTFSVKSYNDRAKQESDKINGPAIIPVESWYQEPKFIQYWVDQLQTTISKMTPEQQEDYVLVVSAHSLPEKILQNGDPYPDQLHETAKLIAEAANVKNYAVGWQSAGQTPEPWLGPDVQDLTRDLFNEKGYKAFIYIPAGFIAEHLEVLYDNDYECKVVTDEIGAAYYRPEMPNANPAFIDALATVIMKRLNQ
ncbi:ferrochelatase [Peribacillus psychrosaccharolyticus]|uniref:Coproporphyrin III ferrochelatase n=1 Tax=Peribacillus psychrosaccharolyticus TaxID=1407 RepID=A0A974NQY3_PERPY|nr:ferrochelatase [Peribacillus psychrosaccharolyticus]MEC2054958.1 ferrochelatase [Peribacillus psychrosaccharolyticus]MED3746541.1 ferrochelatase [Peribacillus psychrosaccharolyticus]QQT02123.1 ferrochelatase [Peribacillus psychrosaccharolyticus]